MVPLSKSMNKSPNRRLENRSCSDARLEKTAIIAQPTPTSEMRFPKLRQGQKVAIFLSQCIVSLVNTHEESELSVTQMIFLALELELNGVGIIPSVTALTPLESGKELKCQFTIGWLMDRENLALGSDI